MRTSIKIITIHGNSNTAPSGTEIFELPFSRMRLLKKDNLGTKRSFSLLRSSIDGNAAVEGIRLISFLTNPMAAAIAPRLAQRPERERKSRDNQYIGDPTPFVGRYFDADWGA